MLKLYHGRTSVCSIKARLALAEKGVTWDSQLRRCAATSSIPAT
jgi:glutathione S-transferase